MKKYLSFLFFILGFLFLSLFGLLLLQRNNPNRLSFDYSTTVLAPVTTNNLPMALSIPSLNQTLAVFPARVEGSVWETTKQGVSYLSSSPIPGTTGNSVIYGHNWSSILGNLSKVRIGDTIGIIFQDGTEKKFNVQFISIVTPDQTKVLAPSDDTRLTLYTCTGFLDSKRLVVTALLDSDELTAGAMLPPSFSNRLF